MRSLTHITPRYLLARTTLALESLHHPDHPWLTRQAIGMLDSWLRPTDAVFEWGSGRSTLWLAKRVATLISVEHDAAWFMNVSSQIKDSGLQNVQYRHVDDTGVPTNEPGQSGYVGVAAEVPTGSMDCVLVDGQHRDECTVQGMRIVAPGGLLVLDNANWYLSHRTHSPSSIGLDPHKMTKEWQLIYESLSKWRNLWTSNGVTDTALFVRPPRRGVDDLRSLP